MSTPFDGSAATRDRLVAAAIDATGFDDFGAPSWQEGLDLLLESVAATADLNEIGVGVVEDGIVTDLSNRLRIEAWRKTHPAVAEQEIVRPIIIVGQPRTGTTILHDLMAQDPGQPRAAQLGDRAAGARARRPRRTRPTRASPRPRPASTSSSRSSRGSPRSTSSARSWRRRTCASSRATSARCSIPCSSRCRRTTDGCCTTPTWPRPTDGTGGSCSTCSPSTKPSAGCSSHPRTSGRCRRCSPSTPTRS